MDRDNDFSVGRISRKAGAYAAALMLVFVLLLVVYANSFKGTWIFDDAPNIIDNEHVHVKSLDLKSLENSLHNINGELRRPLSYLSLGLNYYFGGINPFGYHLVNFTIYVLCAWFLFLLIAKTLSLPRLKPTYGRHAYSIALAATIFWAINPMQVTAVTYIVQRMASMAGLFYVMAMYFYVKGRTSEQTLARVLFFAAALLAGVLGLLSKQNAALLPVSVFLYDLILIQGVNRQSLKKNMVVALVPLGILVVLAFVYTDLSSLVQGYERRPFSLTERILTQPGILFFYVSQLLYPTADSLTLIHEVRVSTGLFSPVTTFLSIAGIFGVLVFALGWSARFPLICFSILFFLVNHAVESTIIPLELIYEHRNYVPSFFFFVPIAVFMTRVLDYFSYRHSLQAAIAILVVLIWTAQGHTVYMRNKLFADPVALWADNVQKAPGLSRVHINLGNAFFEAGDLKKAYESYILAQKADYFHNPENQGVLYYNLGRYYFHSDREFKKALQYLDQGRRLYPGNWRVWYYSALCQAGLGRYERAWELSALACTRWPENEMLQYVRGLCLLKSGNHDACIHAARDALAKDLSRGRFYKLMGVAYLYMDQYEAAARILEMALDRMPDDEEIMLALIDAHHQNDDGAARNRTVVRLFCKKKESSWEEYLNTFIRENRVNAYAVGARLQKLIREAMEDLPKKMGSDHEGYEDKDYDFSS